MNASSLCPGVDALRDLVAGRLAVADQVPVRDHLGGCARCRAFVDELEDETGAVGAPPTAMCSTLTAPLGESLTETDDDFDLSFLEPSSRPDALGRLGDYEVIGLLGRGGMGIVLKAFDGTLHRVVAVKVLSPKLVSSGRARRRFLREARSAAAINHPNVVTIHAVNEQDNIPYLVMECVIGQSLRQRIQSRPPSPEECLRIALQIANGLSAAHEQGVIHRDVKPANIMLEEGLERAKITDFGLALVAMDRSDVTSVDQFIGTPAYMSPEQVAGGPIDPRSDLFSLGCVMYAMLVGNSPFKGSHPVEIIRKVSDHRPPAPHELDPGVPRALSAIIMRLLEKSPEDRYQSASALADDLKQCLVSASDPAVGEPPVVPGARIRPGRWLSGIAILGLGVLGLAVLVGLGVYWSRSRASDHGTTLAPPRTVSLVTGSPSDQKLFRRIGDALAQAHPGDTIRLLDGSYEEAVRIVDGERSRGITIESSRGTVLKAPGSEAAVVEIRNTPGVVLRGLHIQAKDDQFSVSIKGDAQGVTLDDIHSSKPADSQWAHIYITGEAHGAADRPIRVRGSTIESGHLGLVIEGVTGHPVSYVDVEGNRFTGLKQDLEVLQDVHDIRITGNIFVGGEQGVLLNLPHSGSQRVTIANNSFFRTDQWIHPRDSVPDQEELVVFNNAVFESAGIDGHDPPLSNMVPPWQFHHNLWEAGSGTSGPMAERVSQIEVMARDPADPDFLRPTPGASMARAGAGGAFPSYIGAVSPAADVGGRARRSSPSSVEKVKRGSSVP